MWLFNNIGTTAKAYIMYRISIVLCSLMGALLWLSYSEETEALPKEKIESSSAKVTPPQKADHWVTQISSTKSLPLKDNTSSKRIHKPLSQIKSNSHIQKTAEPDDAPIVALDRPDDMVYPLTRDGISQAMTAFNENIKDCYVQALETHPDLNGQLLASFRIERPEEDMPDQDIAHVSEVEVLNSELDHTALENCIMDNLDQLWFDPPEGEYMEVKFPFVFGTEQQ